ncbi:YitT family protein [Bacillus sp. EB600]|uniref:YitT family protein n=1 Tax=Bacillus sp. EB600 TaxID=2806345 RepID=UPI002108AD81|nr:YitT family protein [Bacillus sp. EB600]MCQ6279971.1 YitT family protein [Bacillus sp. EB600]
MAVIVGSLLLSIGINGFLVPHQLLDGGITGLALILHYYFGYPTGLTMLLLSIPLCIYAWVYDRDFCYNGFLGLITASIMIDLLEPLKTKFLLSILPSALLGGAFIGIGVGIMFRYKASTGGTDLLAQMISEYFSITIGVAILMIDGLIAAVAFKTLGLQAFLFSCITICFIGVITSLMARPLNS